MEEEEQNARVRIKDIADMAGVSVGTVDRVLHGRKNISQSSLDKVKNVLKELHYVPNHYASALASNKTYNIGVILPMHEVDSYWARVENGIIDGLRHFSDFKIHFRLFNYDPFNSDTFEEQFRLLLKTKPYAVIIGPLFNLSIMKKMTTQLVERNTPYALIDSNWPELHPVTFYGQDSVRSGEFAARIILMAAADAKKIALFKLMGEGRVASRQQLNREEGFRRYVAQHSPKTKILDQNLYVYDKEGVQDTLSQFFTKNKDVRFGLTFNSSVHTIADFLKNEMPRHGHVTLLGYDAIDANVRCIKEGTVDFLIAQHPREQGLNCLRSLINSCVLNIPQQKEHYVSIELLTRENIDFYRD